MLPVLETVRLLELTRPGRLLPWLGPALRGLIARRFKAQVCRWPAAEQDHAWRYCRGCPFLAGCPYGQTLEPDPPPGAEVFHGQEDATRPLVLAPGFPVPVAGAVGLTIPVRAVFIGLAAARHADAFWDAVREAGADPATGLGQHQATFAVHDKAPAGEPLSSWLLPDLPLRPDALSGVLPRLRVELTAPLFLSRRDEAGRRREVAVPEFADLLRACLRTLGGLARLYGPGPLPADFAALKEAATEVPLLESAYRPFRQPKWSNRNGQGSLLRGVVGGGVYGDVPLALARWLLWGGRLHVGGHRVAGAGGWRVAWGMAAGDDRHPLE